MGFVGAYDLAAERLDVLRWCSVSGNAATNLHCFECGAEWNQPLTETLTAPVCPKCGRVGDRELSLGYPAGILAGRSSVNATPWEFVQDDENERRGVARVLDAENRLVCETSPENADLIVCAVNYLVVAES